MSDQETLTPEQQDEIKELNEHARRQANVDVVYNETCEHAKHVFEGLVELFGRETQGPMAYVRTKATEKLEECMHRLNDGMYILKNRETMAEQAVANAVSKGTLKFPGVK